jgi:multidrug efflux pump subunit AcrB
VLTVASRKAEWIWRPRPGLRSFSGLPFTSPDYEQDRNLYVYFRRALHLDSVPSRATAHVSADGRYKLFVNGALVGRGPARCDPLWQCYDSYDLAPHLRTGANVIAILMVVIGLVALINLPVAQYPDVTPPTVQVTTRYPGANARTVVDTVALPIEQQVNGVEGMIYMQSFSGDDGSYSLTVTFQIGTDLNFAQVLVQNRVATALASLPQAVQVQGVTTQKKSTAILQIIALSSSDSRHDSLYLANYATIRLKDELSRLPGVGNVAVFGAGQYSMRIWLDPEKLQARALTPRDVINSLQQQSQQVTAGQIGAPPVRDSQNFQYTLNIYGRLDDAEQFANVIVKTGSAGEITRVRDIGRVELGAQTYAGLHARRSALGRACDLSVARRECA